MTISPPAKVKKPGCDSAEVLSYNLDTLYLAIDIEWLTPHFFKKLEEWKTYATNTRESYPTKLIPYPSGQAWKCLVRRHGSAGYEWLLESSEYFLKIGNWSSPISKPSVIVEIRSETLWRLGPDNAIKRVLKILRGQGAKFTSIKPSRVDLCLDILLDESIWVSTLIDFAVTRARYIACHYDNRKLQGLSIGKGIISARLYDKPLEIKQQSKKTWMYDVWGINEVPEGKKIIRVEFQLRREIITQLGLVKIGHLLRCIDNAWAYCTKEWLKFRNRPGEHHTMRKTLPWWEVVQGGYNGVSDPHPLIRYKAYSGKIEQLQRQAYGQLAASEALVREYFEIEDAMLPNLQIAADMFVRRAEVEGMDGFNFVEKVLSKQAKFNKTDLKMLEVVEKRKRHSFPSNLSDDQLKRALTKLQQLNLPSVEANDGPVPYNR